MVKLIEVWRKRKEDPDYMPNAAAIYMASWSKEPRLVIFTVIEEPVVYIAPPVASPFCQSIKEAREVAIVKRILDRMGARFYSFCRVARLLYRGSIDETLKELMENGLLDPEPD
ncbi:MAG: hypothetical protein ABWW69_03215 [Pyrodictiaceae archaeon]